MYKILIVEDDLTIARILADRLASWGYTVSRVEDFARVYRDFLDFEPQLVLMDLSLPFYNGYHWCAEIRKVSKVPILFLSSASDDMNIVMAMNMGGDDFIAKPFDLNVLIAKIQAILRRAYDFAAPAQLIFHRDAALNLDDATLTFRDQKTDLTRNELKILQLLLENKGKVVGRDTIMERLWSTDSFIDDNTLTVNMSRLRRKLEDTGLEHFIVTKKGLGYMVESL